MIQFDPIIGGVKHYTYHRKPTRAEIKFGEGATHYRDFPVDECDSGKKYPWGYPKIKRWLVAKDDGLRYYR